MDDVFSCGETAWGLIHDRSYSLLRKKYTPSLKDNPGTLCYVYFFICGVSSLGCWFAFISYLLYYQLSPNTHFLYYLSAYTLGSLPILSLHKSYEQNISKMDLSKWPFIVRMAGLSIYGITTTVILSYFPFSLVVNLLFILGLGASHGALLGGLSHLASAFPDPCNGALLLGVDLAGVVPFLIIILSALLGGEERLWGHALFIAPAFFGFIGLIALFLLLRSKKASHYLGHASSTLRHNTEGLETLLSRSGGEESDDSPKSTPPSSPNSQHYVSLSSFLTVSETTHPNYQAAIAWGVAVFACTFCTFFMIPFFPETRKTHAHFPVFLFFAQHFADIAGRELLCTVVKNAVKSKALMWILVILRALLIGGWLAEVLIQPFGSALVAALEIGGVILCGLVGGAINPAVYTLASLRISNDSRDSVKAIHCCMWCSVAGSLVALLLLNIVAFIHPLSWNF